jgi:hypothetical protein
MLTKELFLKTMDIVFFPHHINNFPGAQPVALSKEKLPSLLFGYLATLKTDGEREFLWIDGTNVFAINRNLRIWHITSELEPISTKWMLLDAECVDQNFFHAFDLLVYDGKNVCDWDICERMHFLHVFLTTNNIPFLSMKPYYSVFDIVAIYKEEQTMPVDGILFVRRLASYQPFRMEMDNILKWKPIVTLDFFAETKEQKTELYCLHNNTMYLFATEIWPFHWDLDKKIVECKLDVENHWNFIRVRTDKNKPNTLEVVESTLKTMNITLDDLERLLS